MAAILARPAFAGTARTALAFARYASTSADSKPPAPQATFNTVSLRNTMGLTADPRKHTTPEQVWARRSDVAMSKLVEPPTPYSGRTVEVKTTLNAAWNMLRAIISKNNVVNELRRAQRHEKKGYKRRRLRSERWRRLFASQVREKVQLVQSIVRRGA